MNKENITSSRIQLLPEHLVDQIKAGEVVERPSALLKELLENSIDAGANQIEIHIVENGMELISVEDNGEGMNLEDLPYAFCRHATSKISRFEDLYSLSSFGFRGEALASIAASSRLTCHSTPKNSSSTGGKIVIHGGFQKSLTPHKAKKHGTSLFIKDLFFNTPARLKFIKSKVSEKNALKRIIHSFILSNPHIEFRVRWDEQDKVFFNKENYEKSIKRISTVFFGNKKSIDLSILNFNEQYENYFAKGYISKVCSRGHTGKSFYLFINGRLFTDRAIHQAVIRSMDKIWQGASGHYYIALTLPPDEIDVNVHPSKTLIKFNKPNQVISLISAAIKEMIKSLDLPDINLLQEEISLESSPNISKESSYLNYLESLGQSSPSDQQDHHVQENSFDFYNNKQNQNYKTIQLSNNFSLVEIDNTKILINKNKFISLLLDTKVIRNYPIDIDSDITPLLIGAPYKSPSKKVLNILPFLSKMGFLFDLIENNTILLRSTPSVLALFPIEYLIYDLFLFFEAEDKIRTDQEFIKKIHKYLTVFSTYGENIFDDDLFLDLLESSYSTSWDIYKENKVAIKLDQKTLEDLFI